MLEGGSDRELLLDERGGLGFTDTVYMAFIGMVPGGTSNFLGQESQERKLKEREGFILRMGGSRWAIFCR